MDVHALTFSTQYLGMRLVFWVTCIYMYEAEVMSINSTEILRIMSLGTELFSIRYQNFALVQSVFIGPRY